MKTICHSPWFPHLVVFFLAVRVVVVSQAIAAEPAQRISATSKAIRDKVNLQSPGGCSHIYGFNYQPTWGYNGLTVWGDLFDAEKYRKELVVGKKYFPNFNAVRIWLSWSAYRANPDQFIRHYRQAIDVCGELDLLIVPTIFSRWVGGPPWDRVHNPEILADFETTFAPFLKALVTPMKGDLRILAWDLCNEPFTPAPGDDVTPVSRDVETQWLGKIRQAVKQYDPDALVCIGTCQEKDDFARCIPLSDILTPHLYCPVTRAEAATAEQRVATFFEEARTAGRPMMVTECCWGAIDDAERADIVRANLQLLKQYKIGFFPHALWNSEVSDLYQFKNGERVWSMPFILGDGSLRPGHGVYNEFTQ